MRSVSPVLADRCQRNGISRPPIQRGEREPDVDRVSAGVTWTLPGNRGGKPPRRKKSAGSARNDTTRAFSQPSAVAQADRRVSQDRSRWTEPGIRSALAPGAAPRSELPSPLAEAEAECSAEFAQSDSIVDTPDHCTGPGGRAIRQSDEASPGTASACRCHANGRRKMLLPKGMPVSGRQQVRTESPRREECVRAIVRKWAERRASK